MRITPKPARANRTPYDYFTVTRGRRPGVFNARWAAIQPLVSEVPGAIYKGYSKRESAILEYYVSCQLGIVAVLQRPNDVFFAPDEPRSIVATHPSALEIRQMVENTPITQNASWYAVFKGIRTGVFPFWSV